MRLTLGLLLTLAEEINISFCSLLYNSREAMDFRQLFLNKHNEVDRNYWAVVRAENYLLSYESKSQLFVYCTFVLAENSLNAQPSPMRKRKLQAERNSHLVQSVKYFSFG